MLDFNSCRHGEIDAEQQEYQKLLQEKTELQAILQDLDNTINKTHNQVTQTTDSILRHGNIMIISKITSNRANCSRLDRNIDSNRS